MYVYVNKQKGLILSVFFETCCSEFPCRIPTCIYLSCIFLQKQCCSSGIYHLLIRCIVNLICFEFVFVWSCWAPEVCKRTVFHPSNIHCTCTIKITKKVSKTLRFWPARGVQIFHFLYKRSARHENMFH